MSGINHLYDIYNKKGEDFVNQLFNSFVTINEKMDGTAFTFERDEKTGKFKFFKRDQRNPITFVDRTLMKYYERPIQYIESLPPNILEEIPRGWRFGLEYFANNKPVEITYDRVPKNNLILSYVHQYEDGKIKKTIQDKEELDNWADVLGIDRAPIIFQGYLTDDQKGKILEFLRTPFENLVERFKTQSFVRFIIGVLNPELKKSALNEDLDKDVEGIVFRFGDPEVKENEPVLAKMVDPVFTQLAKEKTTKQKEYKPSDFLGLTLLDVMNFILEKGVDAFKVEGDSEDERYVSFMSDVFANFLEEYSDKYRGADFEEPDYLKRDEFRLNKDLIDDRRVLKYVNEDDSFESLFKLMLNSFRKIKTRAGGIITKGMMEQINLLIRDIKDYIQKPRKGKLNESGFMSYLDFRKEMTPEVEYLKEEDEESEADENPFYSYKEFISALETIDNSPSPKKDISEDKNPPSDLKEVNLLIGRFQPFHNGHLKMVKTLKEKNGLPSVVVVVNPGHNKSGKTPFSKETVEKFMKGIIEDEKDVEDFIIVPKGLIGSSIVKLLNKGYRVNLVGAGEDRMNDYLKQIEYVKRSDIKDQMHDLKLVQTPRVTSATEVRQAIKDEDYQKFRKLVPTAVEKMYSALKSEMNPNTNESKVLVEHMSLDFDQLLLEAGTPSQQGKIRNGLFNLRRYLANLKLSPSLSGEDERNLEKILDLINVINNLSKGVVKGKSPLKSAISSLILGSGGDKKSIAKKEDLVEDLIADMEGSTIDNLISRYVSKSTSFPIVTLKDIINNLGGRFSFNPQQDFNGISPRDIKKIYSIDPKIPSGNQRRGKGEALFSIAFDSPKNPRFGGDVDSPELDKVVEIKSTNNAGIEPEPEQSSGVLTSPVFSNFLDLAHKLFPSVTDLGDGKIQKTSSTQLIQEMKEDNTKNGINGGNGPKTQQLIDYLERMIPKGSGEAQVQNVQIDDVIPLLLLFQINHYSYRCKNFKALAVFVEVDGSPEEMVLIECFPYEEGENFVTQKNLNTIKNAGLAAKITSKRPEIYKP